MITPSSRAPSTGPRVNIPKLTAVQTTNAEVLVEVRFLDWATDDDAGMRVCEDRHQLRSWDHMVPEVRDITTAQYGAAPGSRVAIVASISSMDGQIHPISEEVGRVPGWEGMEQS